MQQKRAKQTGNEELLRTLESAAAYPVMVTNASAPGATRSGPADETQRIVDSALRAVLGGRTRVDDPNGLKAALARSFVEDHVNGRRVYRNVPRGSLADTVAEGEVSGFQGALMAHAREVIDHGLPLLENLKSLVPTVDDNDIAARASIVRSNVLNLRDEFGRRDGPRPAVIDNLLDILLGSRPVTDPDLVGGAVGRLRDDLGLATVSYANNIEDEHQLTHFRLLAEYVVGLRTAWQTASPIFGAGGGPAFVSALMRHIELTTQTITESIYQVRTAMDSVFLGEAERRIQRIDLPSLNKARMTIEEILEWAEATVSPDSITLIRDGGRIAIADSLVPTVQKVGAALENVVDNSLPGGLEAPRVKVSLRDLQAQWRELELELKRLADQSVAIPDVRGKKLDQACEILRGEGLRCKFSAHADKSDIVLSSDPDPGHVVQPGQSVSLATKACGPRNGAPAQGTNPPKPGPVIYLNQEDSPDWLRRHTSEPQEAFRTKDSADWRPTLERISSLLIETVNVLLNEAEEQLKVQNLSSMWPGHTGDRTEPDLSDTNPGQRYRDHSFGLESENADPAEDRSGEHLSDQTRREASREDKTPTPSEVFKAGDRTKPHPDEADKNGGGGS